ncbi:LysR substrate-binding domain-containing protein [Xanthomonas sacchari]|uniref:LysR substrate-binding domain-containing protein n=1 Tax=Xanthomonas sacchari TaxID=56458 RepID=UPI003D2F7F97
MQRFATGRRFALVANDLAAQLHACAAGHFAALLPRFPLEATAGGALVELPEAPRRDVERKIWLVVHPDVRRAPRVQRVAEAIADVAPLRAR